MSHLPRYHVVVSQASVKHKHIPRESHHVRVFAQKNRDTIHCWWRHHHVRLPGKRDHLSWEWGWLTIHLYEEIFECFRIVHKVKWCAKLNLTFFFPSIVRAQLVFTPSGRTDHWPIRWPIFEKLNLKKQRLYRN